MATVEVAIEVDAPVVAIGSPITLDEGTVHRVTRTGLRFQDPATEARYREWYVTQTIPFIRVGSAIVLLGGWLIIGAGLLVDPAVTSGFLGTVILTSPGFAVALAASLVAAARRHLQPIVAGATAVWGVAMLWGFHTVMDAPSLATTGLLVVIFFAMLGLRLSPAVLLPLVVLLTALHWWWLLTTTVPIDVGAPFHIVLSMVALTGIQLVGLLIERTERSRFRLGEVVAQQRAVIEVEHQRSAALLRNAMPDAIARRLLSSTEPVVDRHDAVTVLFTDIVGFTSLCESLPAEQVVALLNTVFSRLDDLAEQHGVEKVKTIGDAYMAVAGAPEPCADHAERMAEMALDVLEVARTMSADLPFDLQVRVGLATGDVVAGVIGRKRYAYDLWSATVNIASRMESQGVPGRIQVTAATADLLRPRYLLIPRPDAVEVKGQGPMRTWFLEGRRR